MYEVLGYEKGEFEDYFMTVGRAPLFRPIVTLWVVVFMLMKSSGEMVLFMV